MSSENVPKRKGRSDAGNIQGGGKAKAQSTTQERAKLSSHSRRISGKVQIAPRTTGTAIRNEWLALLDAACTSAAIVANRLALTTRYLDTHDHMTADGCLGADVARVAAMAVRAAQAAEMLHAVAADYADWLVAA
jgi:hypothetical protein